MCKNHAIAETILDGASYESGRRAVPSTVVIRAPLNLEQIGMANARIDLKLAKELGLTRGDMGPLRHAKACRKHCGGTAIALG